MDTGVVDSSDSNEAGSSSASGSATGADKPLDAAFQEFGKIADLLK
jgi:hypothetical protein